MKNLMNKLKQMIGSLISTSRIRQTIAMSISKLIMMFTNHQTYILIIKCFKQIYRMHSLPLHCNKHKSQLLIHKQSR
jgi:hypothetical protein